MGKSTDVLSTPSDADVPVAPPDLIRRSSSFDRNYSGI